MSIAPEVKIKTTNAPIRKKALNYKAVEVTKRLFQDNNSSIQMTIAKRTQINKSKRIHPKISPVEPSPSVSVIKKKLLF